MRDQRRHAALEQAIEQTLALRVDVIGAFEEWSVEIAATVALGADRTFLEQAVEQRLDRRFLPIGALGEDGDHFFGAERVLAPEHIHDHAFCFTD
jgi:hypothetical protein